VKVRIFFSDGTKFAPSATLSSGCPIVPARGDTIMLRGVPYVATHVQWDYEDGEIDVLCTRPNESSDEKLYYDENTLNVVFAALTTHLHPEIARTVLNEIQNKGILFRERAKD
jgi:hypothetical protein